MRACVRTSVCMRVDAGDHRYAGRSENKLLHLSILPQNAMFVTVKSARAFSERNTRRPVTFPRERLVFTLPLE